VKKRASFRQSASLSYRLQRKKDSRARAYRSDPEFQASPAGCALKPSMWRVCRCSTKGAPLTTWRGFQATQSSRQVTQQPETIENAFRIRIALHGNCCIPWALGRLTDPRRPCCAAFRLLGLIQRAPSQPGNSPGSPQATSRGDQYAERHRFDVRPSSRDGKGPAGTEQCVHAGGTTSH